MKMFIPRKEIYWWSLSRSWLIWNDVKWNIKRNSQYHIPFRIHYNNFVQKIDKGISWNWSIFVNSSLLEFLVDLSVFRFFCSSKTSWHWKIRFDIDKSQNFDKFETTCNHHFRSRFQNIDIGFFFNFSRSHSIKVEKSQIVFSISSIHEQLL